MIVAGFGRVVSVVEPENAGRVRWKPAPEYDGTIPERWGTLLESRERDGMAFQLGVLNYLAFLDDMDGAIEKVAAYEAGPEVEEEAVQLWEALAMLDGRADLGRALWTLEHDAVPDHRLVASLVLMNFPDDDVVWWSLLDALRDPVDSVRATSMQSLTSLGRTTPRAIDWEPAAPAIASLLAGTNLSALHQLCDVLIATEVSPQLAPDFMSCGGHALFAHAASQVEPVSARAQRLLERLSGESFGADVEAWRAWSRSLDQGGLER